MKIVKASFDIIAENIQLFGNEIVMFGAGAIGQVIVPEIIHKYGLIDRIKGYVDNDCEKWGKQIDIKGKKLDINPPHYLCTCSSKTMIFVNISRYSEVIEQLERMECTEEMMVLIMPMLLIQNFASLESIGTFETGSGVQIPKTLHYMWLGKREKPELLLKCMSTWKEKCPDYEIVEWNESNYDVSKHIYMKQAYECEAFGFVPDYARLDILYNYGGFYLDTDVELLKSLDGMLHQEAFCGVEKWQLLNFGGCSGSIKGNPMIKKFLDARENLKFVINGKQIRNTCGYYDTKVALQCGYRINGQTQCIQGMNVLAYDYFHPYDYVSGILNITHNTISIHHFNGGWLDEHMKQQNQMAQKRYYEVYENATML